MASGTVCHPPTIWIFYGKSFRKNNNKQSNGQIARNGESAAFYHTLVDYLCWKHQFCGFPRTGTSTTFIDKSGSDDLQACIDGRAMVPFIRYVTPIKWKSAWGKDLSRMSDVRFGRECINWQSEWVEVNETFKPAEDVFGWLSIFGSNFFFASNLTQIFFAKKRFTKKNCMSLIENFLYFIFTTSTARGLNIYLIFAGLKDRVNKPSGTYPTKFQRDMWPLRRRKIGFIRCHFSFNFRSIYLIKYCQQLAIVSMTFLWTFPILVNFPRSESCEIDFIIKSGK